MLLSYYLVEEADPHDSELPASLDRYRSTPDAELDEDEVGFRRVFIMFKFRSFSEVQFIFLIVFEFYLDIYSNDGEREDSCIYFDRSVAMLESYLSSIPQLAGRRFYIIVSLFETLLLKKYR